MYTYIHDCPTQVGSGFVLCLTLLSGWALVETRGDDMWARVDYVAFALFTVGSQGFQGSDRVAEDSTGLDRGHLYILQRGVQWEQCVVVYTML